MSESTSDTDLLDPIPAAPDAPAEVVGDDSVAAEDIGDGESGTAEAASERSERSERRPADLEREGDVAADYLEGLLDILDLDGDLDLDVEGDRAVVAIVGSKELDKLVGRGGETVEALQELARLAVVTATGSRSRLMLDIAGWRAGRRSELAALGVAAAERVVSSGTAERLSPMSAFERKVVHDAAATVANVRTESEGDEPQRRVVILPA